MSCLRNNEEDAVKNNNAASSPEGDFGFTSLLGQVRVGRMSIDDFFSVIEFEKWLMIFCYRYGFRIFEGQYEPEDFLQDCRQKVVKAVPALEPDNTPNEGAFFGWLKTIVFHTYLDALRRYGKPLKYGQSRSDVPMEELTTPSLDEDYDGKYFLSRFLKFIKVYRAERQFAIMLWLLEDRSYRDIQEILHDEGIIVSHVTVASWVKASLDDFRESLGLPLPE